jgi:hypothetical protein
MCLLLSEVNVKRRSVLFITRGLVGMSKYVELIQYILPKMFERIEFISLKSIKFSNYL